MTAQEAQMILELPPNAGWGDVVKVCVCVSLCVCVSVCVHMHVRCNV